MRQDRLDNFWFTIIHELAHLLLHLDDRNLAFFDDTDQPDKTSEHPEEKEANEFTRDRLIPPKIWVEYGSRLMDTRNEGLLLEIAEKLKINPAILAGRARWESMDYSLFAKYVGHHQVREQFEYV